MVLAAGERASLMANKVTIAVSTARNCFVKPVLKPITLLLVKGPFTNYVMKKFQIFTSLPLRYHVLQEFL